jgi:hypothetical protein
MRSRCPRSTHRGCEAGGGPADPGTARVWPVVFFIRIIEQRGQPESETRERSAESARQSASECVPGARSEFAIRIRNTRDILNFPVPEAPDMKLSCLSFRIQFRLYTSRIEV